MGYKKQKEEIISSFKNKIKELNSTTNFIHTICIENEHDYVCGSWVNNDSMCVLTIRKREGYYSVVMSDTTKCYKVVRECFRLDISKGKLIICEAGGNTTLEQVTYVPDSERLIFGSYGVFTPEDVLLLNESAQSTEYTIANLTEF